MSLGTIHSNLYKGNAEEIKSPVKIARNLNVSAKQALLIVSFLMVSFWMISSALAVSVPDVTVVNSTSNMRIVPTGGSATLQFNVSNRAESSHAITIVNITNATGYIVTAVNATGNSTQACNINQLSVNCTNLSSSLLGAGSSLLINLTVTTPDSGSSAIGRWYINTRDSNGDVGNGSVVTAAIDDVDIAFDIQDELNNITRAINASVYFMSNGTSLKFNANLVPYDGINDGLILVESTSFTQSGATNFNYTISSEGFVNTTASTNQSYVTGRAGANAVKPSGLRYKVKVTVADELGNALSGYSVNITSWNYTGGPSDGTNTTGTPNATAGHIQFFALRNISFYNISINVSRSGYINNGSYVNANYTNATFLVNTTVQTQITGNSTYVLPFVLKVTATDELGVGGAFVNGSGVLFRINNTNAVANRSSNNVYYFALPNTIAVGLNMSRSGYVNTSLNNLLVNTTLQANPTLQSNFTLNITVVDELGSGAAFTQGVIIALNNTTSSSNTSTRNTYYFNISDTSVNLSVARLGYINSTNMNGTNMGATGSDNYTSVLLNQSLQANIIVRLNFSVRVTDLCNELGGPGHCFALTGALGIAELSGNGSTNTTYSGNDAYINASNGVSVQTMLVNGSKNGFVNRTITIRTNQTSQVRIAFNNTDPGGSTDRANGLPFTIKVLGVFDELGTRNFTLNNSDTLSFGQGIVTTSGNIHAGVDIFGQQNSTFYNNATGSNMTNGNAYVNATGTDPVQLVAFLGNQSLVNSTKVITPNPAAQQTVLFNGSNQLSADLLANGLNYTIKITVQDELGAGNSSYMNSGLTFAFNTSGPTSLNATTPDAQSGNVYYFSNQSANQNNISGWVLPNETNFTVSRIGYINTSSAVRVPINASNQTSHTIQLPFNLKVAANDELAQALGSVNYNIVNFTLNNTVGGNGNPNATSGAFAYWAVTIPSLANNGTAYVNMSKIGYVDNRTAILSVNSTNQTLANSSLLYTVRVFLACDEVNASCFNINGNIATDGTAAAEISGLVTNYSAGVAYIPLSNYTSGTVTLAARGYVNQTVTARPTANFTAGRNSSVAFNMSFPTGSASQINGSALQFTVRVQSICDQLNYTCFLLNGSEDRVGAAGINISLSPGLGTPPFVNVTRYNNTSNNAGWTAYISAPHGVSVNLTAFSLGYVNSSQNVTGSASSQTTINWNSTIYGLNYTVRLNLQDELTNSTNMNLGVLVVRNVTNGVGTLLTENQSYFRSSPSSNVYYLNVSNVNVTTGGGANVSVKRDGYINTSSTNYPINSTGQANITLSMPFSVKVNSGSVTGITVTVTTGGGSSFSATDGNIVGTGQATGDTNSTKDGVIYWALNQSNVTSIETGGSVNTVVVSKSNYQQLTWTSLNLNYSTQMSLSPSMVRSNADDTTAPVINITSIAFGSNVTTQTPTISFTITDVNGSGIEVNSIVANMSGFSVAANCGSPSPADGSQNISCSFTTSSLTDGANHTVMLYATDIAGNIATNGSRNHANSSTTNMTRTFGVDSRDGVVATLNTSDTSALNDNTYANGWSFTFDVTLGSTTANATDVNATAVKVANWTRTSGSGASTIPTSGNTIMNYTHVNGTAMTYYVSHEYNTTDTIYPLKDLDLQSQPINGTVTIYVKLPSNTLGTYSTTFTFGSWSKALTGGSPT